MRAREKLGSDVPLFVNRRFDLALAAAADGVAPAGRRPAARPRPGEHPARIPDRRLDPLGRTRPRRRSPAAPTSSSSDPIFDTPSKRAYGAPARARGPRAASRASRTHDAEVFAIGGIDEARIAALDAYRDRISGVAAVRLFQESADPRAVGGRIAAR